MKPIGLHRENTRYLEYDGKLQLLVGSGEHYGALMNLDFDYVAYLDALAAGGLNLTRTFCGTYREVASSFKIRNNTMAPAPGRFCCVWQQVGSDPDAGDYNEIYDLSRYNPEFFERLKDFLGRAETLGIFVELVLFCYLYTDELWRVSPMHPARNSAGLGARDDRLATYDVDNADLLEAQLAFTRKVVAECQGFSNVYFELMNEPYSLNDGRDYNAWQNRVADAIVETEAALPEKHLIARNYQNRTMVVDAVHPGVSIVNFHYAEPSAVHGNYRLALPIGDDETGFKGQTAQPYRIEAWRFMLSGGAIFSHLDYSFTVEKPDGTAAIIDETPGAGSPELRRQFRILKEYLESLPLAKMHPAEEAIKFLGSTLPTGGNISVLSDFETVWAMHITGSMSIRVPVGLPVGVYGVTWMRPIDGRILREETLEHATVGGAVLQTPIFGEDICLTIRRKG